MKKKCSKCKRLKPLTDFYRSAKDSGGLRTECKVCGRVKPEAERRKTIRKRYGITVEQYDAMLLAQSGRCAICKTDSPGHFGRFVIDHDHKSGVVRGLLCSRCNVLIGHAGESAEILSAAIEYLGSRS